MSVAGTLAQVLKKTEFLGRDFIEELLFQEHEQGCNPAPGAYGRIKAALIEAVDREVKCTTT